MPLERRTKDQREKAIKAKPCPFQYFKVDKDGLLQFGKDLIDPAVDKCPEGYVELPPPEGLYQPKFDGEEWIEVGTAPTVEAPPRVIPVDDVQKEIAELKAQIASLITNNNLKAPPIKLAPTKEVKG